MSTEYSTGEIDSIIDFTAHGHSGVYFRQSNNSLEKVSQNARAELTALLTALKERDAEIETLKNEVAELHDDYKNAFQVLQAEIDRLRAEAKAASEAADRRGE